MSALPNRGRERDMVTPPSLDGLVRDPDEPRDVRLVVVVNTSEDPTTYHWMLIWDVIENQWGQQIRRINVVQERGYNHLTYFGPATVARGETTRKSPFYFLGTLTLSQRKELETIADGVDVLEPDGKWNCQDWTTDVLTRAVEAGLMDREIVQKALAAARDSK